MKKILTYTLTVLFAIVTAVGIESCNKDDDPTPTVFVISERNTGNLFTVNAATGEKTAAGQVTTAAGAGQTNIRGMIYNKSVNKLFASGTDDGGGSFYSIEPKTLKATTINEDVDDHVYGVADLLLTAENRIMGSLWFKSNSNVGQSSPGLLIINTDGSGYDSILFSNDNICCGMAMEYGASKNEILVASYGLEIYKSDLSGTAILDKTLVPEGFDLTDPEEYVIQGMVKDASGKIYATVYGYDDGNTYFATVDLTAEKLIKISQLNATGTATRYHGLVLLPQSFL